MFQDKPEWIAHQRKRWMRPDAHLWISPNISHYSGIMALHCDRDRLHF